MDQQRTTGDDCRHELLVVSERGEGGVDGTADSEGRFDQAEEDVVGLRENVVAVRKGKGGQRRVRRGSVDSLFGARSSSSWRCGKATVPT